MKVEIYGNPKQNTKSGSTVSFIADDASPVTSLDAEINPSVEGNASVVITANGEDTEVNLTKSVYGGDVNVTSGVVTETYGGGAYDPANIPADLKSIIDANTTEETASGDIASFECELGEYPITDLTASINPIQDLHGYDNPWPAGGGKNKLNPSAFVQRSGYSNLSVSVNNNVLTISGYDAGGRFACFNIPTVAGQAYTAKLTARNNVTGVRHVESATEPTAWINGGTSLGVNAAYTFTATQPWSQIAVELSADNATVTDLQFEAGSTATSYAPYSNICPISGWTGANIHVSPTTDSADGETYSITFPSSAGTVYGGTLDVTTGKLTVDRAIVDLGALTWNAAVSAGITRFRASIADPKYVSSGTQKANMLCTSYATKTPNETYTGQTGIALQQNADQVYIYDPQKETLTATEFKAAMSGIQLVYELATPIVYDLTPTEVSTLLGTNNVWSDTGAVEVTYRDGNVSAMTELLTDSTALTTGENVSYPLEESTTYSIARTPIMTVAGENTMSANTGDIAVTWSTRWFDITPWIAWQGLTFSRNDVDAPDAGRDMSGLMHRGRVAVKEKMNIQTVQLTRAQSSFLQTLLYPMTIRVRVTPYPRTNDAHTMSMYTNNVKTTYVIHRENGEDLQSLSFPLIEN